MELAKDSILYIVLILTAMILGYIIFLLYKDIMYLRESLSKLRDTVNEIEIKQENVIEGGKLENCIINNTHDDSDNSSDSYSSDSDESGSGNLGNSGQEWGIFDQLMLNPDQLQGLQEIQSEIKGTKMLTEESNGNVEEIEGNGDEIEESEFKFTQIMDDMQNTCNSILKTGKNKGSLCSKICMNNSTKCKLHHDKQVTFSDV